MSVSTCPTGTCKSRIFNTPRLAALAIPPRKARDANETLYETAFLIEVGFLSFLLALWITWWGLSGLFRLLPGPQAVPFHLSGVTAGNRRRNTSSNGAPLAATATQEFPSTSGSTDSRERR